MFLCVVNDGQSLKYISLIGIFDLLLRMIIFIKFSNTNIFILKKISFLSTKLKIMKTNKCLVVERLK